MANPSPKSTSRARMAWTIFDSILLASLALPVIWLTLLIARHGVSIPTRDDWEMAPLIAKFRLGSLSFHDFFVQQQESRTIFPKLLFVLLSLGGHWDVRLEMALSVVWVSLTAVGIFFLLRRSALSSAAIAITFWLSLLLIFSPAQHELWLLASGFPSFIPALCIVLGLAFANTELSMRAKFIGCALVAVLGSFSLASGLFAWGLTFPVLLLIERPVAWKKYLCGWSITAASCAIVYFWGYVPPGDVPKFAPHLRLLDYAVYLCGFLGSGFARAGNSHPLAMSVAAGGVLLTIWVAALGYAIKQWHNRALWTRLAPWLALGLYSIGCGCLAALGRIDWGMGQSLESRYVAFSLYLGVGDMALLAILCSQPQRSGSLPQWRNYCRIAIAGGVALFATLYGFCALESMQWFALRSAIARAGKGAVLFSATLDTSTVITNALYPRPKFVVETAELLDRLHILNPPLIRTAVVKEQGHKRADGKVASGWCDAIVASKPGYYTAIGWASFAARKGPADGVVLAYQTAGQDWTIFALSDSITMRADVAQAFADPHRLWSGWLATFPEAAVPFDARISAWVVDASTAEMYRLNQNAAVGTLYRGGRAGVLTTQ